MISEDVEELQERIKKLEGVISYAHKACLCERFITEGFDYHETHPRFGEQTSSRKMTPKDYIEKVVGFDWEYEKSEGPSRSWKILRFWFK